MGDGGFGLLGHAACEVGPGQVGVWVDKPASILLACAGRVLYNTTHTKPVFSTTPLTQSQFSLQYHTHKASFLYNIAHTNIVSSVTPHKQNTLFYL